MFPPNNVPLMFFFVLIGPILEWKYLVTHTGFRFLGPGGRALKLLIGNDRDYTLGTGIYL